jgi:hypothetical protein
LPGTAAVRDASIGLIFSEWRKSYLVKNDTLNDQAHDGPFCSKKRCTGARKDDKVAVCGNGRAKGKVEGIRIGATIKAGVDRIQIEGLALRVIYLDPGVVGGCVSSRL